MTNFGTLTLSGVKIVANTSTDGPGGIADWAGWGPFVGGSLTLRNALVDGNSGGNVGGMFAGGAGVGPVTLIGTTVSNNSGRTGGINMYGQLTLIRSRVIGNISTQTTTVEPGGIDIGTRAAHLTLTYSTVSGNTPCDVCED